VIPEVAHMNVTSKRATVYFDPELHKA